LKMVFNPNDIGSFKMFRVGLGTFRSIWDGRPQPWEQRFWRGTCPPAISNGYSGPAKMGRGEHAGWVDPRTGFGRPSMAGGTWFWIFPSARKADPCRSVWEETPVRNRLRSPAKWDAGPIRLKLTHGPWPSFGERNLGPLIPRNRRWRWDGAVKRFGLDFAGRNRCVAERDEGRFFKHVFRGTTPAGKKKTQ